MKIFFLTKHEISWGSSRERVGVYLDFLKRRGHQYRVVSVIPDFLSKLWIGQRKGSGLRRFLYSLWYFRILKNIQVVRLIFSALSYDVIFIQKINITTPLLWLLRARNGNLVYDFDDNCLASSGGGIVSRIRDFRNGFGAVSSLAMYRLVFCGNDHLARAAKEASPKINAIIIPTAVDCETYFPREKNNGRKVTVIGWAGSGQNHFKNLSMLASILKMLRERHGFIFRLVGSMGSEKISGLFSFLGDKYESVSWADQAKLCRLICDFDIGLMPLVDDHQSRGKCGFKLLQYMAAGLPVVASPVGVNKEIVSQGINGYLAKNEQEWVDALSGLINDPAQRGRMGLAGRKLVMERFSLDVNAPLFFGALEDLGHAKTNT